MNIEAKQVWQSVTGELRQVIGIAVNGEWLIETIKTANLLRVGENQHDIVFDKLIRNADGTPAEPPEPESPLDVETRVYVTTCGAVEMHIPPDDGTTQGFVAAVLGTGHQRRTCVGFRFREDPEAIWPNPINWHAPSTDHQVISLMRRFAGETLTIATHAVWRRLGANAG